MPETEELEERAEAPGPAAEDDETVDQAIPAAETEDEGQDPRLEALQAELDLAQKERDEHLDQLRRSQADFENIRKRLQKEKEEVVRYAASDMVHSLLPALDDYERAMASNGIDAEVKKGLELIHRRIFDILERAGLREVEQSDTFDPSLHFAVDRAPAEEGQADQQILEVYQKGYHFKERLLRAAMVKVAVKE